MRDVCIAPGVPMEFFWNMGKMGGANTRFKISQADLLFQILGDALAYRFCTRLAYRYLQWRLTTGKLITTDPNWRITWQMPRRVTVDNGNDNPARLNNLSAGATTLKRIYGDEGENWIPHTRQWFREWARAKAIAGEEGVPEAFNFWRASMPGAQGAGPTQPAQKGHDDDDDAAAKPGAAQKP